MTSRQVRSPLDRAFLSKPPYSLCIDDWTAIRHTNTEHPHIHVVLAGCGSDLQTDVPTAVRLHLVEYEQLRKSGRHHREHDWQQQLAPLANQGSNS